VFRILIKVKKTTNRSKITAHHEAGHAVAASLARLRFRTVTIIPDEVSLGRCSSGLWNEFYPDYDTDAQTNSRIKPIIFSLLAGHAAESKFTRSSISKGSRYDHEKAFEWAGRLCGSMKETQAYVNFMMEQTSGVVGLYWKEIKTVATALLEQKTLNSSQVRKSIMKAGNWDGLPRVQLL
jgi:ATP-dependent Zn protease